jgi:uncharacterized protein (DUF2384 family)
MKYNYDELVQLICTVIRERKDVEEWLLKNNPAFDGRKPIDVWAQGDHHLIEQMVMGIQHGVYT